jgi:hypothetical protein
MLLTSLILKLTPVNITLTLLGRNRKELHEFSPLFKHLATKPVFRELGMFIASVHRGFIHSG